LIEMTSEGLFLLAMVAMIWSVSWLSVIACPFGRRHIPEDKEWSRNIRESKTLVGVGFNPTRRKA